MRRKIEVAQAQVTFSQLFPWFGPRIMRDAARSLYQEAHHQEGRSRIAAVLLLVVSNESQIGSIVGQGHRSASPMNSGFSGRWGRNRTGALRLWRSQRHGPLRCVWLQDSLSP
jgi:hypothetical protein